MKRFQGIRQKQPDVVFLDIDLSGGVTGFDVLEKILKETLEVIFVTAFNHFAARAFSFQCNSLPGKTC
jgi:two-component system LytT family response regulator